LGHKTISITEEAYELLSREKKGRESFSEVIKRLAKERGKLKDSFGAWKMSDDEEERIFPSLKKNWKRTTPAIRTAEEKPPEDDQDVDKLVKSLLKLKRAGREPLVLRLKQTATKSLANERGHRPT
jgi:predicted CopG family antitoxin